MIAFKLALRNLIGAGLRTWLNVFILSLAYVMIIWHRGFLDGWQNQAKRDTIQWEIGGGQYWHPVYDPYDPFALQNSHGTIPPAFGDLVKNRMATPVLITRGTIYPEGRMISVLIKGLNPEQAIIQIPASQLADTTDGVPAVIGKRMAKHTGLQVGDYVTVRWRDTHGTFDAREIRIADIFQTNDSAVDNAQIWISLPQMQSMLQMPNEATVIISSPKRTQPLPDQPWIWHSQDDLLADINNIIKSKSIGGSVMYVILMALAMLAIFDTQVLSLFKRQREIGTHIALGMTRGQVIRLFTVEGAMHGILAALMGAVYGIPLLRYQAIYGFQLPAATDDYGITMADKIYPIYSLTLVVVTVALILVVVTFISYWPTRRISKMNPTDAIRGKIQ